MRTLLDLRDRGEHQEMLGEVARLPVSNYTDPGILERELDTVFRDYPLLAGHASQVSEPGSYLLSEWDRIPYVVVRDAEGSLRAFINICRHRGAQIVSGDEEELRALVCPYHGWTYGLDGQLKSITKSHNFPGIDKSEFGLIELPVTDRMGLVWVHPTPGASMDIDAYLGDFGDDIRHFGVDGLKLYRRNVVTKQANWKLLIKTYLEGYHVPVLHRGTLSGAFKRGVISYTLDGSHLRLAAARTNILDAREVDEDSWRILEYASVYYSLFPNTFFIMHPDYVSMNHFYPLAPDRTVWVHDMVYDPSLFEGAEGELALKKRFEFTNDVVFDQEDFAIAEQVQGGFSYGADAFHTLGLEEGLLSIFQRNIDEVLQ